VVILIVILDVVIILSTVCGPTKYIELSNVKVTTTIHTSRNDDGSYIIDDYYYRSG
jgi:hypothetical protein